MIVFTKRAERLLQNGSEKSIQRPILELFRIKVKSLPGKKYQFNIKKIKKIPDECNNCFKILKAIFSISIFELFAKF